MPAERNRPKRNCFNSNANLPFQLRLEDFEIAMQDVYDLFYDVNTGLLEKGLEARRFCPAGDHVGVAVGFTDRQHGEAFACADAKQLFQRSSGPSRERRLPE